MHDPSGGPSARADERRREQQRVQILGELHGEVMVLQPVTIHEISRGGAELDTAFPLQINSLHEFRLTLGEHSMVAKGRVVHSRISDVEQESVTYRSGIEFVELSERALEVIGAFIDAIVAGRRAP